MKKILLSAVFLVGISTLSTVKAQSSENLDELKARKELLKLNTKLNDYKIKLAKENNECDKAQKEVEKANREAGKGAGFSATKDVNQTANEAKAAAKIMKDAQRANERLAKCQRNAKNYEKDIRTTESKIEKLNGQLEFTGKNGSSKREAEK